MFLAQIGQCYHMPLRFVQCWKWKMLYLIYTGQPPWWLVCVLKVTVCQCCGIQSWCRFHQSFLPLVWTDNINVAASPESIKQFNMADLSASLSDFIRLWSNTLTWRTVVKRGPKLESWLWLASLVDHLSGSVSVRMNLMNEVRVTANFLTTLYFSISCHHLARCAVFLVVFLLIITELRKDHVQRLIAMVWNRRKEALTGEKTKLLGLDYM